MLPRRCIPALVLGMLVVCAVGRLSAQLSGLRITNMSSNTVTLYLDDTLTPFVANLQPGATSLNTFSAAALTNLRIMASGGTDTLFNGMLTTIAMQWLNLVLFDSSAGSSTVDTLQLMTGTLPLAPDSAQVRFVHTVAAGSNVGLRISDSSGNVWTVDTLGYGGSSSMSTVARGQVTVELYSTTTGQSIYRAVDTLVGGARETIFATADTTGRLALRVLNELDPSPRPVLRLLTNLIPEDTTTAQVHRFRLVNLLQAPRTLRAYVNGMLQDTLMYNDASALISVSDSNDLNLLLGYQGGPFGLDTLLKQVFNGSEGDSITDIIVVEGLAGAGSGQTITLRRPQSLTFGPDSGMIRIVNASTMANGEFDIRIVSNGDTTYATNLGFMESGTFAGLGSGTYQIALRQSGTTAWSNRFQGNLIAGTASTLLLTGNGINTGISVLNELDAAAQTPMMRLNMLGNDSGRIARLRAVHLIKDGLLRFDILLNDTVVVEGLGYREASGVVQIHQEATTGGTIGIALPGDTNVLAEAPFDLGAQDSTSFTTLFAIGAIQNGSARLHTAPTGMGDAGQNGRVRLRVLNAVADDAGPGTGGGYRLTFDLTGGETFEVGSAGFGQTSTYSDVAAGNFTLHLMRDNDSTTMTSVQGSLQANSTYTLILNDPATAGRTYREDRRMVNSAAPIVDVLLLQDMVGNAPSPMQGPIPVLGQVSSVGGVELVTGLRVVPNPVKDVAYLRYGLGSPHTVTITLLDAKGAIAATFDPGPQDAGTYQANLGVSQLPVGTYTAVLFDERGDRIGSTRLVIQR